MSVAPDLFSKVLGLPGPDRAELAHRLLLSLEIEPFDQDCEAAWAAELELRANAIDSGEADATDWREAVERMRQNLRKGT